MFREIGYGFMFLLCAAVGGCAGACCLVPAVRGGSIEAQAWEEARAIVIGAIGGSILWLWYRYTFLRRPKNGQKPD